MKIKIKNKEIYNGVNPYIIAEIGANHNGDMELAKKLIISAKECGCDAVKFQSWTPSSLIAKEEYERNQKYNDSAKKHFGSLKEMVTKYYLREEQHYELKQFCEEVNIDFCSSGFSTDEVRFLEQLGVPFFKTASMDINNLSLLRYIAQFNKPILLSTGMASLSEIEKAVEVIEKCGNTQIVLLHCISIYPPLFEDIHLNNILMLNKAFGYPSGFSDHSIGFSIPLASVALGSCVIEKHFTLDKDLEGWDHEISANPEEMKIIVQESKNIVKALGSYRRTVTQAELEKRKKFRRSIVANYPMDVGHIIQEGDVTFKRPGTGISPDQVEYIMGRNLTKPVSADELITWEHF
ncbi:MAG: N-acetylneuraminate synthase family protein [Bdellovibrionaceae bacterium]|nr:N-acetylneuraminate synthase family protein [Pseudobdellovibrionaceae bacterium]